MNRSLSILLAAIWLWLIQPLSAQDLRLNVELSSGAAVGWWVYDKGFTDTLPQLHRGFDRTHLSFVLPVDFSVTLQQQRWEFGLGAGYRQLQDDQMVASDHRRGARNTYYITERNTNILFFQAFGQLRYELLQFPRFSLAPSIKLGRFWVRHTHPQAATFRQQWVREIGLMARFKLLPRLEYWFMPQYADQLITVPNSHVGERHNIYTIGILAGLRYSLTR
jgi:hypothetical protein